MTAAIPIPRLTPRAGRGEGWGWVDGKGTGLEGRPPGPPARLEAGPEGGLDAVPQALVAGRGLGGGTPLGASLGCPRSQFVLFLEPRIVI